MPSLKTSKTASSSPSTQPAPPIGRAGSKEALEQAHASDDVQILSAADVKAAEPSLAEAATAGLDGPFAAVVAQGAGAEPAKEAPKADPFDHDGKGGPGGSLPGKDSTAAKGAAAKKAKASK